MTSAPVAGPAVDPHAKQIHVEEAGEGPALVFTHGFGGSTATWDAQFAHFSKHYHVLRWDMLGHGQSAAPEDPAEYTRERSLDDLARMIERMGGEVQARNREGSGAQFTIVLPTRETGDPKETE